MHKLNLRASLLTTLLFLGVAFSCKAQGVPKLSASEPYPLTDQSKKKVATISMSCGASTQAKNAPLYVVDGTPITQERLSTITPEQIQKIDIVKDSKALALYGPSATNGAVLITLKK